MSDIEIARQASKKRIPEISADNVIRNILVPVRCDDQGKNVKVSGIGHIKKSTTVGKALLDTSGALGANLMISRACSDRHERETILGEILNTS